MQNYPYQNQLNTPSPNTNLGNLNYWSKGIMSLIFGLAVFNSVAYVFPQENSSTLSTPGQISEFQPSEDYRLPVFTFQAQDGKTYSVVHQIPYSEFLYSQGKSVEVNYDPANPNQAWIKNDPINVAYSWSAQVIGGYYVFVGLFIIFLKLKKIPNDIIATLHRGISGITYGVCALLAYPLMDSFLGYNSSLIPAAFLNEIRTYLPWVVSLISVSGFIVIVLTIISVRKSLMKYVPPTI
jgi:hypothetical protein